MKLSIYMKSGNVIKLSGVSDWKTVNTGNEVTSLMILYRKLFPPKTTLLIKSIDLSQIEAITATR